MFERNNDVDRQMLPVPILPEQLQTFRDIEQSFGRKTTVQGTFGQSNILLYTIRSYFAYLICKYWQYRGNTLQKGLRLRWDPVTARYWLTFEDSDSDQTMTWKQAVEGWKWSDAIRSHVPPPDSPDANKVLLQPAPIVPADLGFTGPPGPNLPVVDMSNIDDKMSEHVDIPKETEVYDDGSIKLPEIPFEPLSENKEEWVTDPLLDEPFVPKPLNLAPDPIVKTEEDGKIRESLTADDASGYGLQFGQDPYVKPEPEAEHPYLTHPDDEPKPQPATIKMWVGTRPS